MKFVFETGRSAKISELDKITHTNEDAPPGLPKGLDSYPKNYRQENPTWFVSLWWVTHDAHTDDERPPTCGIETTVPSLIDCSGREIGQSAQGRVCPTAIVVVDDLFRTRRRWPLVRIITWSRHSRLIVQITRSAYIFSHGDCLRVTCS